MATKSGVSAAIRTWQFLRISNVGDVVGPRIVTGVSGVPTVYSTDRNRPRLFSVGSILGAADQNAVVWGSGLMDPDPQPVSLDGRNIFALRGKLTHERLRAFGTKVGDVPLGDPGFLAPQFFRQATEKRFRLGIIPHYADRDHPFVRQLRGDGDVLVLDVRQPPEQFFQALTSCETVASSSLHGLIFAEAYGIPNLWLKLSERVVRTGFKFHDWFSMHSRPQSAPYEPRAHDTSSDLIGRAVLHDCTISRDDVVSGFPTKTIRTLTEEVSRKYVPVSPRKPPTPIFVISFNRGDFLRRSIKSYRSIDRDIEIIVHDNGSDDAETLDVLDEVGRSGGKIYRYPKISNVDELNQVNDTVTDYFNGWAEPVRYVVTDCDVDMSIAASNVLDIYDELLDRYSWVECVGPMLRIRDLPHDYPLRAQAVRQHADQFWRTKPEWIQSDFGPVATIEATINSTFALHRAGEAFRRVKTARRVYYPFEARHLDWYLTPTEYGSSGYYLTSSPSISCWHNVGADRRGRDASGSLGCIIVVERDRNGTLVEKTLDMDRRTTPNWRRFFRNFAASGAVRRCCSVIRRYRRPVSSLWRRTSTTVVEQAVDD